MRHLLTSLALLATFAAAGQTTNPFPYNPDADADGWISVNDLLSLLSIFTSEFAPESWETDSLSAAVILEGTLEYIDCHHHCSQLEGGWRMADLDAWGKHFNLIEGAGDNSWYWLNSNDAIKSGNPDILRGNRFGELVFTGLASGTNQVFNKCLCHLQSSPFVPDVLTSETAGLQEQIDSLEMQLSQASQSISILDSLLSSNGDGSELGVDVNSLPQITSIECIEMGIGANCSPQGGMCETISLGPDVNGRFYLSNSCQTNYDPSSCTVPNWRKFKVHGSNLSQVSKILKLSVTTSSPCGSCVYTTQSIDEATLIEQSDSTFTFFASSVSAEETGLPSGTAMWSNSSGNNSNRIHRVALLVPQVGIIESPISIYFN